MRAWKHGCGCESTVEVKEREGGMEWGRKGQRAWGHGLVNRNGCV